MPLQRTRCDDCETTQRICPSCGSEQVTVREPNEPDAYKRQSITTVLDLTTYSEVEYVHACWNCGWTEELTVTIDREVVDAGDCDE